jgi:hypothetical protein
MTVRGRAALWLATALAAGCPGVTIPQECEKACQLAEWCGLLPSPLGARTEATNPRDNCRERCALTPVRSREVVVGCLGVAQVEATVAARWCATVGSSRETPCAKAAACLAGAFPQELRVLGTSTVTVAVAAFSPTDTNLGRPSCDEPMCSTSDCEARIPDAGRPGCDDRTCESPRVGGDLCEVLGGIRAELALENGPRKMTARIDACATVFSSVTTFRDVTSGPIRAVLKVQGEGLPFSPQPLEPGALSARQPFCLVFYGPPTIARAGVAERTLVEVPTRAVIRAQIAAGVPLAECEITSEACADGKDNDGDGQRDCLDPECARFCPGEGSAGVSPVPGPDAGADSSAG